MSTFFRIAASLIVAGLFYSAWLAVFLLAAGWDFDYGEALLWLLCPLITSMGFAAGYVLPSRLAGMDNLAFLGILSWTLAGCYVGAVVVFWTGPMFIVFGMFAGGTFSLAIREVLIKARDTHIG